MARPGPSPRARRGAIRRADWGIARGAGRAHTGGVGVWRMPAPPYPPGGAASLPGSPAPLSACPHATRTGGPPDLPRARESTIAPARSVAPSPHAGARRGSGAPGARRRAAARAQAGVSLWSERGAATRPDHHKRPALMEILVGNQPAHVRGVARQWPRQAPPARACAGRGGARPRRTPRGGRGPRGRGCRTRPPGGCTPGSLAGCPSARP
jgi:hypothetical protein